MVIKVSKPDRVNVKLEEFLEDPLKQIAAAANDFVIDVVDAPKLPCTIIATDYFNVLLSIAWKLFPEATNHQIISAKRDPEAWLEGLEEMRPSEREIATGIWDDEREPGDRENDGGA